MALAARAVPLPAPDVGEVYRTLRGAWGHAGWWPGEGPLEVCVGAVLVQNTAWTNAARALEALRREGLLSFAALRDVAETRLAEVIRPSGCFNVKARRLKALIAFLDRAYGGRLEAMAAEPPADLAAALRAVPGIGPETADAITLYAAGLPVFVVDAYTRRAFTRLGLLRGGEGYEAVAAVFTRALPRDAALFNDYHAQVVRLGKEACRPRPLCAACPLDDLCPKVGVE